MEVPQHQKKKMSLGKKILIGFGIIIILGAIANLGKDKTETSSNEELQIASNETSQMSSKDKSPTIGEVLSTKYFDVTANSVSLEKQVNTGNQFSDLKAEEGINYLIINATFKNTDKESRMMLDGSVWINYKGKDYEFDKSEPIMLEGWGASLDQINPLTSKTTNIVYKIPSEIKGKAYWQPGRSSSDDKIFLGEL